jgi:Ca-activated chloride channel homolog
MRRNASVRRRGTQLGAGGSDDAVTIPSPITCPWMNLAIGLLVAISIAPGAIVLLSDGANNAGRAPLQAAAEARPANVPIYTIAYGTENGFVDLDGKREPVPVDHEEMKRIAAASNGEYFAAASADQLRTVYENIGSDVGYEKADREVTARFAGYGLALAVIAGLGAILLGAKWP